MKDPDKITCIFVKKNITHYILDELSEDLTITINQHLISCEKCRKHEEMLRSTIKTLQSVENINPPQKLYSAVKSVYIEKFSINDSKQKKIIDGIKNFFCKPIPVYGGLLIFLLVLVGYLYMTPDNKNLTINGRIILILSDSSLVDSLTQKFEKSDTLSLEGELLNIYRSLNKEEVKFLYTLYFSVQDNLKPPILNNKAFKIKIISEMLNIFKFEQFAKKKLLRPKRFLRAVPFYT